MISPLAHNVPETWSAILEGKSGVAIAQGFPIDDLPVKICAQVKNFDPIKLGIDAKEARKMGVFTQFAVAASGEALKDSGLTITDQNNHRIGVAVGSGIGGLN